MEGFHFSEVKREGVDGLEFRRERLGGEAGEKGNCDQAGKNNYLFN